MKTQNVKSYIFKGLMAALMITCFTANAEVKTTGSIKLSADTSKMSHSKMSKMDKKKMGTKKPGKMGADKMGAKKMDNGKMDKMSNDKTSGKM